MPAAFAFFQRSLAAAAILALPAADIPRRFPTFEGAPSVLSRPLTFAHLALAPAAIFLRTERLIFLRVGFSVAPESLEDPRMSLSSS